MAWHEGIYSFIAYLLYFELKRIPHQYQYHYKSSSVQFTFTSKKVRKTKQEILGKQRTFFPFELVWCCDVVDDDELGGPLFENVPIL